MTTGAQMADLVADHNAELDEWVEDNAARYVELREQYARDGIHKADVSPGFWSWVMYTAHTYLGADADEIPGLDDLGQIPPLERGLKWQALAGIAWGVAHVLALADSGLAWELLQVAERHGDEVVRAGAGLTKDEAKAASPIGRARFEAARDKRKGARNGER